MTLDEYTQQAKTTALPPADTDVLKYTFALCEEAGEIAGKMKRFYRGDLGGGLPKDEILLELGDLLWYVTILAESLDSSLATVARMNLLKLANRLKRGTLLGKGDDR